MTAGAEPQFVPSGLDSELYQIEAQLRAQGLERLPAESFLQWRDRIQPQLPKSQRPVFNDILTLHYRYRFDPAGLTTAERAQLKMLSKKWGIQRPESQRISESLKS